MTFIGKATEKGLVEVTELVLAPHFHRKENPSQKASPLSSMQFMQLLARSVSLPPVGLRVTASVSDVQVCMWTEDPAFEYRES